MSNLYESLYLSSTSVTSLISYVKSKDPSKINSSEGTNENNSTHLSKFNCSIFSDSLSASLKTLQYCRNKGNHVARGFLVWRSDLQALPSHRE